MPDNFSIFDESISKAGLISNTSPLLLIIKTTSFGRKEYPLKILFAERKRTGQSYVFCVLTS